MEEVWARSKTQTLLDTTLRSKSEIRMVAMDDTVCVIVSGHAIESASNAWMIGRLYIH